MELWKPFRKFDYVDAVIANKMVKSICLSGTLTEVMRLNVLRILSLPLEDVDMNVGRMYRNNVLSRFRSEIPHLVCAWGS